MKYLFTFVYLFLILNTNQVKALSASSEISVTTSETNPEEFQVTSTCGDALLELSHFNVRTRNFVDQEFPQDHIADFLNKYSHLISKDTVETLETNFRDVIEKTENGTYKYIGPTHSIQPTFLQSFPQSFENGMNALIQMDQIMIAVGKGPISCSFNNEYYWSQTFKIFSKKIAYVPQGHVGFSTSVNPILGSDNAAPCIILAAYNPDTKSALLMHMDGRPPYTYLSSHLDKITEGSHKKTQIHLAGGWMDEEARRDAEGISENKILHLINLIKNNSKLEIISADFGFHFRWVEGKKECRISSDGPWRKKLTIDARNGRVCNQFSKKNDCYSKDKTQELN